MPDAAPAIFLQIIRKIRKKGEVESMKKKLFLMGALVLCAFGRIVAADNAIAVPAPKTVNIDADSAWIPLFIQGIITSNFQQYSGLTVIDRQNTDMIKAEQKLGENAVYSEEDALQLGKLTHARFIVTGNITKKASSYALIFNITDAETGETKAAASVPNCLASALENGEAANKISYELMTGYGIKLSKDAIAALTKSAELMTSEVQAQASLAKGILAERSGSNIEALTYYVQAQKNNSKLPEAEKLMQNMTSVVSAGNFGARAKNLIQLRNDLQKDWRKLLTEAGEYTKTIKPQFELRYFSDTLIDEINYNANSITISVTAPYLRETNSSWLKTKQAIEFAQKIQKAFNEAQGDENWGINSRYLLNLEGKGNDTYNQYDFSVNLLNDKKQVIAATKVSYETWKASALNYGIVFNEYWHDKEESARLHFYNINVNDADSNIYYISVTPIDAAAEDISILPVPKGGMPLYWLYDKDVDLGKGLTREINILNAVMQSARGQLIWTTAEDGKAIRAERKRLKELGMLPDEPTDADETLDLNIRDQRKIVLCGYLSYESDPILFSNRLFDYIMNSSSRKGRKNIVLDISQVKGLSSKDFLYSVATEVEVNPWSEKKTLKLAPLWRKYIVIKALILPRGYGNREAISKVFKNTKIFYR